MWDYKGFLIKQYVVIRNGYKYSIYESDGFTHIARARTIKEVKEKINSLIKQRKANIITALTPMVGNIF